MEKSPLPTLENELRKLSLGRGALFLAIILVVAVLFFGVFSKKAEEFRLKTLSQSAARAFRPRILEQAIRDVQEQMKVSLALENGESVVIRAPNLEEIYSSTGEVSYAGKSMLDWVYSNDLSATGLFQPGGPDLPIWICRSEH